MMRVAIDPRSVASSSTICPVQIRLIASDLDGTLLGEDSRLSSTTVEALRRAADAGVTVVAATGRSQHSALDLLRPSGAFSWAVCSNGATRYNMATDQLIHHTTIPSAVVEQFLQRLRAEKGEVGVAWETEERLGWDVLYEQHRNALVPRPIPQEGRIVPFPVGVDLIKLLVTHPEHTHDEWLDIVSPLAGEEMFVSTSGTDFVEITHASATKGQELAKLCEMLEIDSSEVVAFGDQVNDLDMIQWAGLGFAMENASPKVKAVADRVAPHHRDHGVATIIDELLSPN